MCLGNGSGNRKTQTDAAGTSTARRLPAKTREEGLFHKSAFDYYPQTDTHHRPTGQMLSKCEQTLRTREHRVYGATSCAGCHLRATCTKAAQGRRIKRYPKDEHRDSLRLVMQHP